MKHLREALKEMGEYEFKVTTSRGVLALHQTQRNDWKAKILDALRKDIEEELGKDGHAVRDTAYGPVIELYNEHVESEVFSKEYKAWLAEGNRGSMQDFLKKEKALPSGMISIQADFILKNLDTNAQIDEADYLHEKEQKELRKKEAEEKKRKKIMRDAEVRAERKRKREEQLAKLERASK